MYNGGLIKFLDKLSLEHFYRSDPTYDPPFPINHPAYYHYHGTRNLEFESDIEPPCVSFQVNTQSIFASVHPSEGRCDFPPHRGVSPEAPKYNDTTPAPVGLFWENDVYCADRPYGEVTRARPDIFLEQGSVISGRPGPHNVSVSNAPLYTGGASRTASTRAFTSRTLDLLSTHHFVSPSNNTLPHPLAPPRYAPAHTANVSPQTSSSAICRQCPRQ